MAWHGPQEVLGTSRGFSEMPNATACADSETSESSQLLTVIWLSMNILAMADTSTSQCLRSSSHFLCRTAPLNVSAQRTLSLLTVIIYSCSQDQMHDSNKGSDVKADSTVLESGGFWSGFPALPFLVNTEYIEKHVTSGSLASI